MSRVLGIGLVLLATGCSGWNVDYSATGFECATDGLCPSGQTCVGRFCRPLGTQAFTRPANMSSISFVVDDTLNQTYASGELDVDGSFTYDAATRTVRFDPTWFATHGTGPFPTLYDDGPWDSGGHEPLDAVPGDHKLGVTVFVLQPATQWTFVFGLRNGIDRSDPTVGWIWPAPGEQLAAVSVGSAGQVDALAATIELPRFGTTDMRITVDPTQLAPGWTIGAGQSVTVRGSYGAWVETPLTLENGVYVFSLGEALAARTLTYAGLLASRTRVDFSLTIDGVPYVDASGNQVADGVTVHLMPRGSGGSPVSLGIGPGTHNLSFTVP